MKRILLAALLVSTGAIADEAAKVEEPAEATVEDSGGHKGWPSLDEWAEKNKFKDGKFTAELLLGYEYSDLSGNLTDPAHALLTRTRLTYEAVNDDGFGGKIQGQYVGPLNDHYAPRDPAYDTVADPEAFRLHEVYLSYTGYDTHARLGSQEIILDNARFIGNVGWRFNAQSFNAGLVKNQSVENLSLLYAYADSINAIDGEIDYARQYHMLNGDYKLGENNKVSAFAYLQRNDNSINNEKVDTFGARFWGKGEKLGYDAMGALQRSSYYGYLKGDLTLDDWNFGLGGEYISGGGGTKSFQTLNGTAHKFNGWADQFLGTGGGLPSGLIDFWGEASVKLGEEEKWKLMAVGHFFNTAYNTPQNAFSGIYGYEVDGLVKYSVCKNFDVLAKAAYYIKGDNDLGNFTNDETVFWLRGTLSF